MDLSARKQLSYLVERVSKSTGIHVDKSILSEIKNIVKQSNENVKTAYEILFKQLKADNSLVANLISFIYYR